MATEAVIPSISGIATLDLMTALEEIVGGDAFQRARVSLPRAAAAELEGITALSWVSNVTVSALIDQVAAAARREPEALLDEAVRRAVERTFKTVWRMFLRFTSDEALIKRTPVIYARGRNVGQLSARVISPGQAELQLIDWSDISDRQMRSIGIGIEAVVALSGRYDVQMSCARTAEGARYELRWRV